MNVIGGSSIPTPSCDRVSDSRLYHSGMEKSPDELCADILVIDVGATSIKSAELQRGGDVVGRVRRRKTPYPCGPERLVGLLADRIARSGCRRVAVGFPGEYVHDEVVRPGNLSRRAGAGTEILEDVERAWRGYRLGEALRVTTGRDVHVVNDATLAAMGCETGVGRELVLTLGTGLGIALVVEGNIVAIRDVGSALFRDNLTYDEAVGERARRSDDAQWRRRVVAATAELAQEFRAERIHFGGGNSRRVSPSWFAGLPHVVIHGNDAPLRGAARYFQARD
jgi:polyphosphate glucokinase